MIIDDPQSFFIYVFHPDSLSDSGAYIAYQGNRLTNKEYMEHWGKWIVMDERENLDALAKKLNPYVESRHIPCIKYDRYPPPMFELGVCVMSVFCDDRARDEVWEILSQHGVKMQVWIYDKFTIEMWQPGGALLETWISSHDLDEHQAEEIRSDVQMRMNQTYGSEDDTCTGWTQCYLP
ncbi:MAG: hypothetical protein SVY53_13485 [Chloroflexota bacterium]|nr:hypothetical protein [Chloroflexota bacterium]